MSRRARRIRREARRRDRRELEACTRAELHRRTTFRASLDALWLFGWRWGAAACMLVLVGCRSPDASIIALCDTGEAVALADAADESLPVEARELSAEHAHTLRLIRELEVGP